MSSRSGYAALALAILLFSSIEVVSKWIGLNVPPLRLAVLRFFMAGLALTPFAAHALLRSKLVLKRGDFILLGGLGLIGVTGLSAFYHTAITLMPANQAAILFSGNPVFVAVLAPALLGERMSRRGRYALALGLAGVSMFLWARGGLSLRSAAGIMMMIAAMFFFALYTVLSKKCVPRFGAVPLTCFACLFGSLALLPVTWVHDGFPFRPMPLSMLAAVAYLALVTTSAAYALYFYGLRHVEASKGSLLFFLKPPAAALLAWLVLREGMTVPMWIGTALILAGTALAIVRRPTPPVPETAFTE